MQECHVIGIELFVSGSNTTKVLDAREEALDQIEILVQIIKYRMSTAPSAGVFSSLLVDNFLKLM